MNVQNSCYSNAILVATEENVKEIIIIRRDAMLNKKILSILLIIPNDNENKTRI